MNRIAPYAKAITGAITTGLGAWRLALSDDIVTRGETIDIAIATITALALVWAIPNRDPEGKHQDESVQDPEVEDGEVIEEDEGFDFPTDDTEPFTFPPADGPHRV